MLEYAEEHKKDMGVKRLAHLGINAMNYLYARRMIHSISKEINCDDPIATVMNADLLASAIQDDLYDELGGLSPISNNDLADDDIDFLLSTI